MRSSSSFHLNEHLLSLSSFEQYPKFPTASYSMFLHLFCVQRLSPPRLSVEVVIYTGECNPLLHFCRLSRLNEARKVALHVVRLSSHLTRPPLTPSLPLPLLTFSTIFGNLPFGPPSQAEHRAGGGWQPRASERASASQKYAAPWLPFENDS